MGFREVESRHAAIAGSRRTRRFLSACLLVVLAGAAAAPHRHKNDVADLVTDGPSDSGILLDAAPIGRRDFPVAESLRWIDDDPCPACFPSDFVATAAARPTSFATLPPLGRLAPSLFHAALFLAVPLLATRSPPQFSRLEELGG